MVLTTIIRHTKRIPMIKFRKGGDQSVSAGHAVAAVQHNSNRAASGGQAIEDWQLPPKYWRRPIDENECDYINRGGPA